MPDTLQLWLADPVIATRIAGALCLLLAVFLVLYLRTRKARLALEAAQTQLAGELGRQTTQIAELRRGTPDGWKRSPETAPQREMVLGFR